jgi:hypothetical protein
MTIHDARARHSSGVWLTDVTRRRLVKLALGVGFLAVAVGLLVAYGTPAGAYELSIYAATPLAFWVAVAAALGVSMVISLSPAIDPRFRRLACGLGLIAAMAIVALPLVRSYYFLGTGDAMTHLGWVKDMAAGRLDPASFLYPATHLLSVVIGEGAGISFRRSTMLMVFAYTVIPLFFLPLCVRLVTDRWLAVPVGLLTAALYLPVNNISVYLMAHPTTQAILFFPFVVYLLIRYLQWPNDEAIWGRPSPWGVVLALASVSTLFVHPQQVLNVLGIFLTVVAVRFLAGLLRRSETMREHNPLYAQTLLLGTVVALWLPGRSRVSGAAGAFLEGLLAGGASPTDTAAHQATALSQIGGSIEELFAKLFLVSLVFVVLAAGLGLLSLIRWLRSNVEGANGEAIVQYLSLSVLPMGVIFIVYFLSSISTQHYRQVAAIVMIVAIVGAVAIVRWATFASERASTASVYTILVVAFTVYLLISVPAHFQSPYIYQPTQHVTESELDGYEYAFEHGADYPYGSVRGGVDRQIDAVYGTVGRDQATSVESAGGVPPDAFNSQRIAANVTESRYLLVTRSDRAREVRLWNGLRYTESGFDALDTSPTLDRVHTTGSLRSYLVANRTAAGPNGTRNATAPNRVGAPA